MNGTKRPTAPSELIPKKREQNSCGCLASRCQSCEPLGRSVLGLVLMRRIDELFLEYPFYGSRQMARQFRREGIYAGRHRVRRLMRLMGLEAIHRVPAAPFEALISNVIKRLRLPCPRGIGNGCPSTLNRIEIGANSITLQFDRTTALSSWREENPEIADRRDIEIINHYRGHLADGEELFDNGKPGCREAPFSPSSKTADGLSLVQLTPT